VGDGTVFRIVQYAPGVAPRHHRTNSIDYAIVLSGSIKLQPDIGTVQVNPGDVVVQRGTIHNWVNSGPGPRVMAYILIDARPAMVNGQPLPGPGLTGRAGGH
jgi:quercetin dioxygenase-like cupin family protein